MAQPLLRAVDICKSFSGVQALKHVSLEIQPGEIHCLAGENGCGKSTLIKVISGVYQQDSGYIEFAGKRFGKITPRDAIASGIQVIYQDFSIFPNLTVMENLAFNTELADGHKFVNRKRMRKIAEEAIAKINFRRGAGPPGRHALRRGKADGRHQPRADVQRAPDHHGRADNGPDPQGSAGAFQDHPAPEGAGHRHTFRQPQAQRGL